MNDQRGQSGDGSHLEREREREGSKSSSHRDSTARHVSVINPLFKSERGEERWPFLHDEIISIKPQGIFHTAVFLIRASAAQLPHSRATTRSVGKERGKSGVEKVKGENLEEKRVAWLAPCVEIACLSRRN